MITVRTRAKRMARRRKIAKQKIDVQFPPDLLNRVDAAAEALGMSRSDYIRQACVERLERNPPPAPAGEKPRQQGA